MQRFLITMGIILVLLGIVWPWLQKMGLGRLPGDIHISRDSFDYYFPLTTSIIISIILTLIFWLFRK